MDWRFEPMSVEAAHTMIAWRYEDAYSLYNINTDDIEAELIYMCDPVNHYYAIYDNDVLVGHVSFFADAQVKGGDYSADALDIGAGMRPDTTGKGNGTKTIAAILDFARERYQPKAFRATIIEWNKRSQKATTNNGFKEVSRFTSISHDTDFIIFMRDA
ncbi:MAG: GNAT family N-acetyltransferase [Phototrophicaceae bacterium]